MLDARPNDILPDARPDNWVDRFAPRGPRPWLKLGRFDRPIGIWLLLPPGRQGVALAALLACLWPDLPLLSQQSPPPSALRPVVVRVSSFSMSCHASMWEGTGRRGGVKAKGERWW